MSQWKDLNECERAIARELGQNPDDLIVNRVGEDFLVLLNMRSRQELIVSLDVRPEKPKRRAAS